MPDVTRQPEVNVVDCSENTPMPYFCKISEIPTAVTTFWSRLCLNHTARDLVAYCADHQNSDFFWFKECPFEFMLVADMLQTVVTINV